MSAEAIIAIGTAGAAFVAAVSVAAVKIITAIKTPQEHDKSLKEAVERLEQSDEKQNAVIEEFSNKHLDCDLRPHFNNMQKQLNAQGKRLENVEHSVMTSTSYRLDSLIEKLKSEISKEEPDEIRTTRLAKVLKKELETYIKSGGNDSIDKDSDEVLDELKRKLPVIYLAIK